MSSLGLLAICQRFDYVREVPQNKGLRVESIQHWSGGQSGDSWCAEMHWMWHDLYFKGNAPIPRYQAVQDLYSLAKQSGWMVAAPSPGDTYIFVNDQDLGHHIGVVVSTDPQLVGISGNTSADGLSSNGDGVYAHALNVSPSHIRFARIPGVQP